VLVTLLATLVLVTLLARLTVGSLPSDWWWQSFSEIAAMSTIGGMSTSW